MPPTPASSCGHVALLGQWDESTVWLPFAGGPLLLFGLEHCCRDVSSCSTHRAATRDDTSGGGSLGPHHLSHVHGDTGNIFVSLVEATAFCRKPLEDVFYQN